MSDLLLAGTSIASAAMIAITSHTIYNLEPQVFVISAIGGLILGSLGTILLNKVIPSLPKKFTIAISMASCGILSLDQFNRLHLSPISHWKFIQNRIVSESGLIAGLSLGILFGSAVS